MESKLAFPNAPHAGFKSRSGYPSFAWGTLLWIAALLPSLAAPSLQWVTPQLLELTYSTSISSPEEVPRPLWLGVGENPNTPPPESFEVIAGGQALAVTRVGAVRRAAAARTDAWSAEIQSRVFLHLSSPVALGVPVTVHGPEVTNAIATLQETRPSRVIHVNPVGFSPAAAKRAFLGFWLGDLGELDLSAWINVPFEVRRELEGTVAFTGLLQSRSDRGFNAPAPYQQVLMADFSALTIPGRYIVQVPGLGRSLPFRIGPEIPAAAARTYALGLLHQRSGQDLVWPDTRFTRPADHTAPAEIPGGSHPTNPLLAASSSDYANNPRHTAPQLSNVTNSLYPFVRSGFVDVSGGHHDAGDYGKYAIDSAQLVHELAFAARYFPGAGGLDSLGIPESGDGVGDLWQMALWEARFLAKLQDTDGGFSFLVYPSARRYENDVMPENGDSQVLWPKNTAASAAATAALAEMAAAPGFAAAFPELALQFRNQALLGWSFLTNAIATHGRDGAYQKLTHYGDIFMHDDELCWAAAALFALTGDSQYEARLQEWLPDPASKSVRRWSWWRLYGGYGNAIRTLAFGGSGGDGAYRAVCHNEVLLGGMDQVHRATNDAYGLSFPVESKRFYAAGWFFGSAPAFDLMAALQASPTPSQEAALRAALWGNLSYEWGGNPVDRTFVTGWGGHFPLHPVSQQAQNDTHVLPPSGQMVGNLQTGMSWLNRYSTNLSRLTYPSDARTDALRYPLYDRFTDIFNTLTEFTIVEQGAGVAVTAGLLAMEGAPPANTGRGLGGLVTGFDPFWNLGETQLLSLGVDGVDLSEATVWWEWPEGWTRGGATLSLARPVASGFTIQAEAVLPDGRRAYGELTVPSINQAPRISVAATNLSLALPTSSLKLTATVVDDAYSGFPLSLAWTLVSGPGVVDFTDPARDTTYVSLREPGLYHLRLTVGDTEFTTEKDLFLTVTGTASAGTELGAGSQLVLYRFGTTASETANAPNLTLDGNASVGISAGYWGASGGRVLRTRDAGDQARVLLPDLLESNTAPALVVEARILARQFKAYSVGDLPVVSLRQNWDASLEVVDGKWNTSRRPSVKAGNAVLLTSTQWLNQLPLNTWLKVRMSYEPSTSLARLWVNDIQVSQATVTLNASRTNAFSLVVGNLDGDIDELAVWRP